MTNKFAIANEFVKLFLVWLNILVLKKLRKLRRKYPKAKQILAIAGLGAFIGVSLVAPGLPKLLKGVNFEDLLSEDEWEKFDERRLKQNLKDLRKRKYIRVGQIGDRQVVQITERGRQRLLKYNLQDIEVPIPARWDGMWRIVTYDIPGDKNAAREALRSTLKRLNFYQLQKSVYLYPYPCQDVVDFLRELYNIGEDVTILTVGRLEGADAYKEYFDL